MDLFESIAFTTLLASVWCFITYFRILNEVNINTQMILKINGTMYVHPEIQSRKVPARIYLFFGVLFIVITLLAGLSGYALIFEVCS